MAISKDMISDSIDISKLIISENIVQPNKPTPTDTAKYNSEIKPAITEFETNYGSSPRMTRLICESLIEVIREVGR